MSPLENVQTRTKQTQYALEPIPICNSGAINSFERVGETERDETISMRIPVCIFTKVTSHLQP